MPKTSTLPLIGAVFGRKREPMPLNTCLSMCSNESVEASTLPYVLEGPLVRPGDTPGWANQPWHYVFHDGDVAWALGGNGRWRLVTVVGGGFLEEIENRKQIAYNATWTSDGAIMRGTFAPGCGDIKPNTVAIRSLLFDEGSGFVERKDWQKVLSSDGDMEVGAIEGRESESEEPAVEPPLRAKEDRETIGEVGAWTSEGPFWEYVNGTNRENSGMMFKGNVCRCARLRIDMVPDELKLSAFGAGTVWERRKQPAGRTTFVPPASPP
ncbi:hypothetical protein BJV78DRAFT_1354252 [Lactifluus subvellereus]|nr:hypothetical protein BJV78DRAFT_1354252 [Lactifluus subvellereus]